MKQVDNYIMNRNKLIAEFMGWRPSVVENGINLYYLSNDITEEYNHNCKQMDLESMKYHTSWDWLMPVVEKIYQMEEYYIYNRYPSQFQNERIELTTNIKSVYEQVISFIEWYNTLNKQ